MTMDMMTFVGTLLTVFVAGVEVGRFAEKIDRFIDGKDNRKHRNTKK